METWIGIADSVVFIRVSLRLFGSGEQTRLPSRDARSTRLRRPTTVLQRNSASRTIVVCA